MTPKSTSTGKKFYLEGLEDRFFLTVPTTKEHVEQVKLTMLKTSGVRISDDRISSVWDNLSEDRRIMQAIFDMFGKSTSTSYLNVTEVISTLHEFYEFIKLDNQNYLVIKKEVD